MSDPPEAGISSYNPPAKEFSSPITNGQSNTPNSTGAAHQGIGAGGKCIGEIDAARPVSSHSPNVTQVIKQPPRPMEATNPALPVAPPDNAQLKTIHSNQSFPSQRVQGGQPSPSNMQVNSQLSASPQVRPSSSSPHQNAGLQSQMELKTSVTGLSASNGPPVPSLDAARTSSMPMQPSTSTPIKNQYPNVPGSSSPVPGPVSQSASVPTASPAAPHGSLYPSPPNSIPSQLSPGQQASPAGLKPQPALSNIPLGSAPALIPAQSSSGPFPAQSSGDQTVNNQPSSGPVPSQSLAGPMPPQPMAGSGPFPSSHSMGGPIPPQSSGGPNPPQLSGAPFPPQSSAAPFPPQPPGGPFPPQQASGQYPPQPSAGPLSMQPLAGQYPPQSSSGPLPPQLSTRSFQTMTPGGQFPPRPPAGPYYGPQGSGPMPPPQSSGPFSSPSSASGPFMSQAPAGGPPSSASFPPSIPNPPIQSSSSYPPFSSATSPPSSSAQVQSQPYPSFPSNAPPSRPPFPQSSSQQFTPPMPQPQFPPSSANSSLSSPPGPFNSPPAYVQSPQYMSGPQPPPPLHPIAPPGNSMPPRPPMPSQYPPRPSFPPTNQPGNWAQANGIPSQLQAESITRQPVPSGVPMYQQGSQQMPPGMQQPSGMGGSMQQMPMNDTSQLSKRYSQPQAGYQPQQQQQYQSGGSMGNTGSVDRMSSQFRGLSVTRDGFNKLWGADCYDLLQTRNILPPDKVEPPKIQLHQEYLDGVNCRPDIFRCTLTKIPETNSLLQKSRLPLGILIHPFKDVNNLPVVQCNIIVRCRACRTYINPFVYFVDNRRWKCNLCFRVNEMPEEFQFDPVTKTYGDPSRRPEIRSSTIEYIAPSEYMLRPPQAAVYLFLLDVSCGAVELGYLNSVCDVLFEELSQLPGDSRTQIGFIAYDSALHFFALADGLSQPQHLVVSDTTEVFLPRPDNLLVNLQECKELVQDLLSQLPTLFLNSHDNGSALGPALQAAYKLMAPTGGRVTVFQTCLPSVGVGALKPRGNEHSNKEAPTQHINPATDFYKRLALDCSGQQVAVDLFILGNKYTDLATLSGVSQFSGGCIHHLPSFDGRSNFETSVLERSFHRYLSRKIGFEAVMRIRCSRGLSIHTFHGHFFVRSTDLLSLPNVNPDAGYGMQVAIDESLADLQNVCFQAALLYTSSKGERRIRVHTLCLPLAANVGDVVCAADQQCIVGLLAKMAVDRSHQSSPADARDAFINVATDVLSTYRVLQTAGPSSGLLSPHSLRLLPLYILALLKHVAFRARQGSLDERVFAMCQMKCLPLSMLMQEIYPDLYPIHSLNEQPSYKNVDGQIIPCPPRLHLSAEKLDSRGVFLLDRGDKIIIYVGRLVSPQFCQEAIGVPQFAAIQDDVYELPALENPVSELLHNFIRQLQSEKPYEATLQIVREDSRHRMLFIEKLVEDRSESALSYYEFLQHLKAQVK